MNIFTNNSWLVFLRRFPPSAEILELGFFLKLIFVDFFKDEAIFFVLSL